MRIFKSSDSGPPCQSARYLRILKSAILLPPYILLQLNLVWWWWSRTPRSWAIYRCSKLQKFKKFRTPTNPRTGGITNWRNANQIYLSELWM